MNAMIYDCEAQTSVKCLVIADDFTGANDTGMQLARRGIQTEVFFQVSNDWNSKDCKSEGKSERKSERSVVLDTESRGSNMEEAYEKVKHMLLRVDQNQYTHIIKKVDSTIRGNIAAEVKAVDEWMNSELLIFMPALPALGRTTVNGIHYLNGIRISETELGKDPVSPVVQDNIVEMLQEKYEECVHHISIDVLRTYEPDFSVGRVFAVDAENEQQMKRVAAAALQTGKRVLFVGTAALMDVILEIEHPAVPALGLIGSISEVTRKQIHYAAEHGCNVLQINVAELIQQMQNSSLLEIYVQQAAELLESGKDLLVVSDASWDRAAYDRAMLTVKKMGLTSAQAGAYTQSILGEIGRNLLEQRNIAGVFLAGGDTAMGLFEKLGADGSEILGEISMGIPLMRLKGGTQDGLNVVTKAGAFGNPDAIIYALRKLKEKKISKDLLPII